MVGVTGEAFIQLGIIISLAAVAALVLRLFRQPQILAYVLVGILITPVLKLITNTGVIESMSAIGIAFLLFLVGMEMDLKSLKSVIHVSVFGGIIQVTLLFVLGYLLALFLGFLSLEAAYVGLMIAFSSTMVVLKLLSDKRELNTLHGRIVLGLLLMEDIIAIFALSVLTSINSFSFSILALAFLKFVSLFLLAYLASKYIFPSIFWFAAKHQELLLILSLAVCFMFSLAFYYLGFSIAIGAFLAGIALGNLEYNLEIISKVKSLRDFFALLFFVSLGMGLSLAAINKIWIPFVLLLVVLLIIKPLIIMTICCLFRYTKKPAFLTANALTQVGEFSLIIGAQGLALGHITTDLFSLIVLTTVVTITITPYLIKYDHQMYSFLKKPLKIFDLFHTENLEYLPTETKPKIVLCGHNRIGYSVLRDLHPVKNKVLVVDYNPEVINRLARDGYHCIYGDATDEEILVRMNLEGLSILISTVPDVNDNYLLISKVRQVNKRAKVMVTANTVEDALGLYQHGADYVILPHFLGGEHVAEMITGLRKNTLKLHEEREKHLQHLQQRKDLRHDHPIHL